MVSSFVITGPVYTFDEARPAASAVLVTGGLVRAVGGLAEVEAAVPPASALERIDLPRHAVVMPGFNDPHLHLLAMAASRMSVDLSATSSVSELLNLVADAVGLLEPGEWLRATGYDDVLLRERRQPMRSELDGVAPRNPVVVRHRSGHAVVANSQALALIGAQDSASGLLSGTDRRLSRLPKLDRRTLAAAVGHVSRELAAAGVCAVGDATFDNDLERHELLTRLIADGTIRQRLTFHPGAGHVDAFVDAGLGFGVSGRRWRIGHAKVMADDDASLAAVPDLVGEVRAAGFPSAVHVLDIGPLDVAIGAFTAHPAPPGSVHRLEHLALCLPEQIAAIAESGCAVATQPSFLVHRAARYARELSQVEREWLYRVASLESVGIKVAASSDAPVAPARPLEAVRAAVERVPVRERVTIAHGLALVTKRAAEVAGDDGGWIRSGGPADLVVLGADPFACPPGKLDRIPVLATWCDGRLVHCTPRWQKTFKLSERLQEKT